MCDAPPGRLGLTTCYDVRFPGVYQRLAHDGGANILLVPSAFTVPTGTAHWHALLRARAIECQAYVVAAAQVRTNYTYAPKTYTRRDEHRFNSLHMGS